jgi:hypothetical protein
MNPPALPEDWQTDWHLAAHVDQLPATGELDLVVAGTRLHIKDGDSGLSAQGAGRSYPVMVVDGEIFVLFGREPD